MRCEAEIRARLQAAEAELRGLNEAIALLTFQVKLGGDGWRDTLERLAAKQERRRSVRAELDLLCWLFAAEAERLAG